MNRIPTAFLSHGSPMHALSAGAAGRAWQDLARRLSRPRAVLAVSAHWETSLPALTGRDRHDTIHDFGGFPAPLYELRYDAPGSPALAQRAAALLRGAGYAPAVDGCRGLDHGAWVPLRWMYPEADVPVVQLSVQAELGAGYHLRMGEALAPLADEGVLVLGSGHVTHNLRDWARNRGDPAVLDYVRQFSSWTHDALTARDYEALVAWQERAPGAGRAHPTAEHFLPLFVALGAAGPGAAAERIHSAVEDGALSMDAYLFQ